MAAVGDKVLYVPHICHAKDKIHDGTYSWALAWKDEETGNVGDPMTSHEIKARLGYINRLGRMKPPIAKHHHLIHLGPQVTWPAVISAVHDDGTCDLEISHPHGGVTLSYAGLQEDKAGKIPHTWHVKGA